MAEMLKDDSSSSSSSSSLASKLGPPLVGFLSVLAISGSVAFISLMGKGKLIDTCTTHSHEEETSHEDYEEEKHSHVDSSSEEIEHSPTHLKSLHEGKKPRRATLKRKKKVRFASDVVDPPCNGQQYRSTWKVSQECKKHEPPCNDQVLEPPLNHHQHYKSKRRVSHRFGVDARSRNDHVDVDEPPSTRNVSQGHALLAHPKMPSKSCMASQCCEMHARLSHPKVPSKSPSSIPANRLALYKGLWQSRLQHSLHCL